MKRLWHFFGSVRQEMREVTWPTRKELRKDVWTVISTSIFYALFFALVDFVLSYVLKTFVFHAK